MTHGSIGKRALLAACVVLGAVAADAVAAAEVYRCTVDGRIAYTDRPCADGERVEGPRDGAPR